VEYAGGFGVELVELEVTGVEYVGGLGLELVELDVVGVDLVEVEVVDGVE